MQILKTILYSNMFFFCMHSYGANFCSPLDLNLTPKSCAGGPCLQSDKILIACQMATAIQHGYSHYFLKSHRILNDDGSKFSSDSHLNNCILLESQFGDEAGALPFLDRMRQCVAGFQDTHFTLNPTFSLPIFFSAIKLARSGSGHFLVEAIRPDILNEAGLTGKINVGDEVALIDGQSPEILFSKLLKLIPGSSLDYRKNRAAHAMTARNFLFTSSPTTSITTNLGTFNLSTFVDLNSTSRSDVSSLLAAGFKIRSPSTFVGNLISNNLKVSNYTSYYGFDRASKNVGISIATGDYQIENKKLCYLQLLNFSSERVSKNQVGVSTLYSEFLKTYLGQCSASAKDLILDLRFNMGGFTSGSTLLALSTSAITNPGFFISYRFTPEQAQTATATKSPQLMTLFSEAQKNNSEFTGIFAYGPNANKNGFPGKIYALITPECVSDCDIVSAVLKSSSRASFIGSHTNGTGGGDFGNYQWQSHDLLKISFPTSLFGVLTPNMKFGDPVLESSILENEPTVADIQIDDFDLQFADRWNEALSATIGVSK